MIIVSRAGYGYGLLGGQKDGRLEALFSEGRDENGWGRLLSTVSAVFFRELALFGGVVAELLSNLYARCSGRRREGSGSGA